MQIEIGKYYENKTWKFLIPCLRGHGEEFVTKLIPTFRLAAGIYDEKLNDKKQFTDRTIFLLFDIDNNPTAFQTFYEWIKKQKYYVHSYCPDRSMESSSRKMIVIKIPEIFNNAYDNFIIGKYSEMYSKEHIEILFNFPNRQGEYGILNLEPWAKEEFIKKLNEEFLTSIDVFDDDIKEIELPPILSEEVFNVSDFSRKFLAEIL